MTDGYRVGIDVGGTFTDLICVTPDGRVLLDKTPTTLDDQSIGVMTGVGQLAEAQNLDTQAFCAQLDALVHGTTTADNTMIEMDGANTGLLVTEGHRDEIELRRVHKEEIWDPSYPAPPAIARRRARIAIPERMDFEGNVVMPLDEDAVRKGVQRLRKLGCTSIAVTFLHSFTNPAHELRARELVLEEFPDVEHVSLSHEVMPRAPEFERTSTTLVNAYVAPRIAAYTGRLTEKLRAAGYTNEMLIMQATGGVMPPNYVARRAVTLLGSGPTGGVMGASVAAQRSGISDFVAVDMGGTSYDVCLVRGGQPEIKTDWNWRYRYYIGIPMV
ncbi:MAG: hydantoinase/oxoprolinase family protein, partial [Acidimicrobiia bacterium]|nr:hydantoinase/oxoprolinase family protein [Acidimicrobiia bacterium]